MTKAGVMRVGMREGGRDGMSTNGERGNSYRWERVAVVWPREW